MYERVVSLMNDPFRLLILPGLSGSRIEGLCGIAEALLDLLMRPGEAGSRLDLEVIIWLIFVCLLEIS